MPYWDDIIPPVIVFFLTAPITWLSSWLITSRKNKQDIADKTAKINDLEEQLQQKNTQIEILNGKIAELEDTILKIKTNRHRMERLLASLAPLRTIIRNMITNLDRISQIHPYEGGLQNANQTFHEEIDAELDNLRITLGEFLSEEEYTDIFDKIRENIERYDADISRHWYPTTAHASARVLLAAIDDLPNNFI